MDPLTLTSEFGLLIWAAVLLRKHHWRTDRPGLVWTMTVGALATNILLYLSILPMMKAEAASQQVGMATLYGFLVFRIVEWVVMVHVFTRLALVLGRQYDLPGGFAHPRPGWKPSRTLVQGVVVGVAASAIGCILVLLWVRLGIFERPIWMEMSDAGATWQVGVAGGIRNLFSEEAVTRLGAQTLLLYHLRRFRWAPWAAIVLSSLFFEIWHSGGTDFYFINFSASLLFAWSYTRNGYESAAIGHCIADWLGLALPLLLIA
jgi:hypothetical protein